MSLQVHDIDGRYEDFVVNEVGLDGQVIVLKNTAYDSPSNTTKQDRSNGERPAPKVQETNQIPR